MHFIYGRTMQSLIVVQQYCVIDEWKITCTEFQHKYVPKFACRYSIVTEAQNIELTSTFYWILTSTFYWILKKNKYMFLNLWNFKQHLQFFST